MTIINTSPDRIIQLGYEGEDRVTVLRFRYGADWLENGSGVFHIRARRHGENQAYNAALVADDAENNCLLMTVTNVELSVKGEGEMQVVYSGENFVKKSPIYSYNVSRAVDEAVDPPAQDVYTQIIESLSDLQTDIRQIDGDIADLSELTTAKIGDMTALTTEDKSSLVSAINEVNAKKANATTVTALSGTVTGLQTSKADKPYVDTGLAEKASTQTVSDLADDVSDLQTGLAEKVDDVQVNGTSIVSDGVANVPVAGLRVLGIVAPSYGLVVDENGVLTTNPASLMLIKAGGNSYNPIVSDKANYATFYGLAKVAGHDEKNSALPVGQYTDEAKVAIQKMLGIYEAPWELIGSGSFDNATSEDCIINTDSNGDAFELTDAIIELIIPQHDADTVIADYGRVYFMRGSSNIGVVFLLPSQTKTYTANSTAGVAIGQITQDQGMMRLEMCLWASRTNRVSKMVLFNNEIYESSPIRIKKDYFNSIKIGKITGQIQYRLYGKRKWT